MIRLLTLQIRFPTGEDSNLVFLVSVDGTDCPIQEPRPFNRQWFSHKFNGPALKYEVAICVRTGWCVWINGPFRGGVHDITIFRSALIDLIPDGRYAIGDRGYRGEPTKISAPNLLDNEQEARFKALVRARHETFNSRLKAFSILKERFRHRPVLERHKACFEAVAVVVEYSLEFGSPLFEL